MDEEFIVDVYLKEKEIEKKEALIRINSALQTIKSSWNSQIIDLKTKLEWLKMQNENDELNIYLSNY